MAQYAALLRRCGVTRASLRARHAAATARRAEAVAALTRSCPARLRDEVATQLATAQAGAALAEVHGPVMHVRYVHELRRLVLAHGAQLADAGVLDEPHDIVHLRLAEIDQQALTKCAIRSRRASYRRHLDAPLPAPGGGHGPLRVLRTQADLDRVEPGDVALVPDAGPAWGWLALAGVALVIAHGGPLGHAPALARECGTGCVVAGSGVVGLVTEGEIVKVSGDTGEVTW